MAEKIAEFSERLQAGLDTRDMKAAELARISGIDKSSISRYLHGAYRGNQDAVYKIAQALNVSEAWLMGYDVPMGRSLEQDSDGIPPGFMPLPETYKVPLVGRIACGQPITAEENIEDYMDVPKGKLVDFCLLCEGDSMIDAGIDDGDVVYIRKQPNIENGQIAAVRIDNEATLKRVYKYPDRLVLQPENRSYPPLTYVGEEMNQVSIEGKAVGWMHWV